MRHTILSVSLFIVSLLLITTILLQQRGSGLGAAFGGEGNVFRTKRGLEQGLHYVTIALACLFVGIAILNMVLG